MSEWIASGLVLLGIYLYGRKSHYGPMVSVIACLMWAVEGCHRGMVGMVALNLILVGMHAYNMMKWGDGDGSN